MRARSGQHWREQNEFYQRDRNGDEKTMSLSQLDRTTFSIPSQYRLGYTPTLPWTVQEGMDTDIEKKCIPLYSCGVYDVYKIK